MISHALQSMFNGCTDSHDMNIIDIWIVDLFVCDIGISVDSSGTPLPHGCSLLYERARSPGTVFPRTPDSFP